MACRNLNVKEDSWDERSGEAATKTIYEIHEQKENCCDSLLPKGLKGVCTLKHLVNNLI